VVVVLCMKLAYWFDREESMNSWVDARLKGVKEWVQKEGIQVVGAWVTCLGVSAMEVQMVPEGLLRKVVGLLINFGILGVWVGGEQWKN